MPELSVVIVASDGEQRAVLQVLVDGTSVARTIHSAGTYPMAAADPVVRRRLTDLGLKFFPREQQTPEALGAYHKADIEKWWPIIKAAGIRAE